MKLTVQAPEGFSPQDLGDHLAFETGAGVHMEVLDSNTWEIEVPEDKVSEVRSLFANMEVAVILDK